MNTSQISIAILGLIIVLILIFFFKVTLKEGRSALKQINSDNNSSS